MAKKASSAPEVTAEDRIAIALERIAIAVERIAKEPKTAPVKAAETLNAPTGPIPKYEPPSAKEGPVGTLTEEMAKLHKAEEKQKAEAKPEPPKVDSAASLLGEDAPVAAGRMATFEEARKVLLDASAKGFANDKLLAIMKEAMGVERLSLVPKTEKAVFGKFIAAIEAACGTR